MNRALWIVQGLLGLFFALASGAPKLLLPLLGLADELPMPIPLPTWFLLCIGVAEVLGGLGLILPGLLRIRPGLTPLAAAGLVLMTIGATAYQLAAGQPESALFATAVGLVCAFVGYGRWQLAPHAGRICHNRRYDEEAPACLPDHRPARRAEHGPRNVPAGPVIVLAGLGDALARTGAGDAGDATWHDRPERGEPAPSGAGP